MPEFTLDPGMLRNQIQVQEQTSTPDSVGQPQAVWTTIWTAMAAIQSTAAREAYQTGQFVALVTHKITVRWPGTDVVLQGGQRVLFGTRVFQVQTVENVRERNSIVHLMCQEINLTEAAQ